QTAESGGAADVAVAVELVGAARADHVPLAGAVVLERRGVVAEPVVVSVDALDAAPLVLGGHAGADLALGRGGLGAVLVVLGADLLDAHDVAATEGAAFVGGGLLALVDLFADELRPVLLAQVAEGLGALEAEGDGLRHLGVLVEVPAGALYDDLGVVGVML